MLEQNGGDVDCVCVCVCVCVQMRLLPVEGGVREAFVFQFLHHLKLKALALSKYVDAAP